MAPPFLSLVAAFLISWVRLPTMNSGLVGVDDLALAWPFGLSPTFRSSSQPAERTRAERIVRTDKCRRSQHEKAHCDRGCMGFSPGSRCSLGRFAGLLEHAGGYYRTTSRKPTPFRGGMKAVLVLISMPILDTLGLALWQLDVGRCGEKVPT